MAGGTPAWSGRIGGCGGWWGCPFGWVLFKGDQGEASEMRVPALANRKSQVRLKALSYLSDVPSLDYQRNTAAKQTMTVFP